MIAIGSRPIPQIEKARVFRNGRSQAVRIPAEYRFQSDEVYILRDPQSRVVGLPKNLPLPEQDSLQARHCPT
jgi:virulence-associated protein VagC